MRCVGATRPKVYFSSSCFGTYRRTGGSATTTAGMPTERRAPAGAVTWNRRAGGTGVSYTREFEVKHEQGLGTSDRPRVAGVVLAAGSSSRMGRNKLLLEVGGETLVRRATRAAVEAGLDEVVVVLGHDEPRLRAELAGLSRTPLGHPPHPHGAGAPLRTGVRLVSAGVDAVVVVLADMPFVTAKMIATLAERHRDTGAPLVASHYGDVQAPPTLYGRALFEELLQIPGDGGAKQVVRRHQPEAARVTWPENALRAMDGPPAHQRARAQLAEDKGVAE